MYTAVKKSAGVKASLLVLGVKSSLEVRTVLPRMYGAYVCCKLDERRWTLANEKASRWGQGSVTSKHTCSCHVSTTIIMSVAITGTSLQRKPHWTAVQMPFHNNAHLSLAMAAALSSLKYAGKIKTGNFLTQGRSS